MSHGKNSKKTATGTGALGIQFVQFSRAGADKESPKSDDGPQLGTGIDTVLAKEPIFTSVLPAPAKGQSYWVKQKRHQSDPLCLESDSGGSNSDELSEDTAAALADYAANADDLAPETRLTMPLDTFKGQQNSFPDACGSAAGMEMPLAQDNAISSSESSGDSERDSTGETENSYSALADAFENSNIGSDSSDSVFSLSSGTESESEGGNVTRNALVPDHATIKNTLQNALKKPRKITERAQPLDGDGAAEMSRKERKLYYKKLVERETDLGHAAADFDASHGDDLLVPVSKSSKKKLKKREQRQRKLEAEEEASDTFSQSVLNAKRFAVIRLDSPELLDYLIEQNERIEKFVRDSYGPEELRFPFIPGPVCKLVAHIAQNYNLLNMRRGKAENSVLVLIRQRLKTCIPSDFSALPQQIIRSRVLKATKRAETTGDSLEYALTLKAAIPSKLKRIITSGSMRHFTGESQRNSSSLAESQRVIEQSYMEKVRGDRQAVKSFGRAEKKTANLTIGHIVGEHAPSLDESNIGHKMLKSMGWNPGEGIGSQPGSDTHVTVVMRKKNAGLGS